MKQNETLRQLFDRKSVRAYLPEPVTEEEKRLILTAATQAPTAGNQQLYTILDITDPQLKAALAESCDHQPFIASAPMVLIFCADCKKWHDLYECQGLNPRNPAVGDLMVAVSDANIAAQNAVTAAQSLGIGSCYIGDIMEHAELHRQLLNLPDYVFPAAMLVFGRPTLQQQERVKPQRCDLSHIVHENAYRPMDGEELAEMFASKAGMLSLADWSRHFMERKYHAAYSLERTRSVAEYLKQFEHRED